MSAALNVAFKRSMCQLLIRQYRCRGTRENRWLYANETVFGLKVQSGAVLLDLAREAGWHVLVVVSIDFKHHTPCSLFSHPRHVHVSLSEKENGARGGRKLNKQNIWRQEHVFEQNVFCLLDPKRRNPFSFPVGNTDCALFFEGLPYKEFLRSLSRNTHHVS